MKARNRIAVTQSQRLQLNQTMAVSLQLLQLDAAGLAQYLAEQAEVLPALELSPAPVLTGQWLPRWSGFFAELGVANDSLPDHQPSLIAHVLAAVPRLVDPGRGRRIALTLVEALAPTGWLDADLATIARKLDVTLAEVIEVLERLQRIEPAGLFARNLQECLTLQAHEADCLDSVMVKLLGRLDLLAKSDWTALARHCEVDEQVISRRFRIIRSFNPKPGLAFGTVASAVREPDLTVSYSAQGWIVALNAGALPALRVDEGKAEAAKARNVLRLLDARNATLLSVARAMLSHQEAALKSGASALRPMKMQDIADEVEIHKSTVSRVVNGTVVDTPHGSWNLRALFAGDMGGDTSTAALKTRLSQLVAAEAKEAPLSDEHLARLLSLDGAAVARRTIAKYRTALRIPPVWQRRRSKPAPRS